MISFCRAAVLAARSQSGILSCLSLTPIEQKIRQSCWLNPSMIENQVTINLPESINYRLELLRLDILQNKLKRKK